jgi:hypothetical protein
MLDLKFYRAFNKDLSQMTNSQLICHYNTNGKHEERIDCKQTYMFNFPDFSLSVYRKSNPDLQSMSDFELIVHFFYTGRFENREYKEIIDYLYYSTW